MRYAMADRLKARCQQLGLTCAQASKIAGVNRTFVYDIMRGKSANPNLAKLDQLAQALKVERNWLIHGLGDVQGEAPLVENPDDAFVAVSYLAISPSVNGGHLAEEQPVDRSPYQFQRSWIKRDLKADPANLRIMHVEGDSMVPTLHDGDLVLVDLARRAPTPPGMFVLHDGMGLVAKRLEHIPNSDPPQVRIISDNPLYKPFSGRGDELNIVGRIRWFTRAM